MQVDSRGRSGRFPERSPEQELTARLKPRSTLRVQFLVDSLVIGGAERVIESLCLGLSDHDVLPLIGCFRSRGPVGEALAEAGVEVQSRLAPDRGNWKQIFSLRTFLLAQRAHVVYCLDHSNVLWYGRLAARLAGVRPQVVAVHRTRRADGRPSLGRSDRLLMPWTQRVIAVSEAHAAYLQEEEGLRRDRIVVIHNGVDPNGFESPLAAAARDTRRGELGLPPGLPLVGIVAALRPEKNHRLLLEALVRIPEERRPHLAVVGDGPLGSALRDAVTELDLRRTVHWLGARNDVPWILPVLDVLALSSDPNVETFPMCVLEAMAASTPVVSTDVGSLSEMVQPGRTGLLVPPGNPSALAEALDQMLQSPDRGRSLGVAGAARVREHFPRSRMVQRTAELLWEISGRTRSRTGSRS